VGGVRELTDVEARRMRLVAQGLHGSERSPADAVRHMVALQGQDLPAVLRAIAVRSAPGTTLDDVRAAFDAGELVRSWAMRGTLFVAAPDDLAVLHAATGERMRRQEWRMCEVRGIEQGVAELAADVLVEALADGPLPRPAMLAAWEAAGISTAGGRGYHLLALLAYDGLVRFGPFEGRDQLLIGGPRPVVPDPQAELDAALARMVAARGPIDTDDVAWWMGLPKVPVRASLERAGALGGGLEPVRASGREMLVASDAAAGATTGVVLVPAFDEWILGYRDRALAASREVLAAVVPGGNGVFRPMVLVDGVAVGTWRIPAARSKAQPEPVLEIVERVSPAVRSRIDAALAAWPHR
jgi:hypothetical protein